MDYQRIYNEFIADRKSKPTPAGYVERHHIVPRALGGGDESENLIELSAEDHFFAHLLLARIHGGPMWCPVALMIGGVRKGWRARRSRRDYGWAKRAMGSALRGEGAHQFDWKIYDLYNAAGECWSGKQSEMVDLGMSRSLANMLIKGRVKSAQGWVLAGNKIPSCSGSSHPAYNSEKLLFRHVDGRKFFGTSFELSHHAGITPQKASNIRAGRQRVAHGWYRDGFPPSPVGRGAKLPNAVAGRIIRLRHIDGGEFVGTERQACERYNLSRGNVSMVICGQRKHTKGWQRAS